MDPSSASPSAELSPAERLRRSEEAGRALVAGWEASGMTMRAYAQHIGVQAQRLSYWKLRLRPREAAINSEGIGFVEIARPTCGGGVTIELPSGVRLRVERGFDATVLRSVVSALAAGEDAARC